jgi:hypothetical protein
MRGAILMGSLLSFAGCLGTEGDETSVCDLASQHIAACLSQPAPLRGGTCDTASGKLAQEFLSLDCSGIQSLQANSAGKADDGGCLAPWDCPEKYPVKDETCGYSDRVRCQRHCDEMYSDNHLRLRKVSCEVLEGDVAHCQCQGYWLPWSKSGDTDTSTTEGGVEEPAEQDPIVSSDEEE